MEVVHMQDVERSKVDIGSVLFEAKRFARRYGRIGLAEPDDIVQNAMLKLLCRRDGRHLSLGLLYTAVRCAAFDAGRKASRESQYVFHDRPDEQRTVYEGADENGYRSGLDSCVADQDDIETDLTPGLKNMLEKLRKPLRQVLLLHSEGYSYREIAQLTNVNIGTVRSRLHYARRRAKSLLGDMA
jgi:RNA polymerase sigma factor (sigma-70 family)